MKNTNNYRNLSGAILSLLMLTATAKATETEKKDWTSTSGLLDAAGVNLNEMSFLKNNNLTVGGWIEGSASANFNRSADNFNGTVTFHDRSGEFQMNQFYLWLQKAVTASSDKFDFGGRIDFMYGSDSIFTQAYGVPTYNWSNWDSPTKQRGNWDLNLGRTGRFYSIALPQAYAEFNLPFGNGVDVKVGHFYTPIGYEVVTAPDNFFITKPYTFQYGEPFTHVGILSSYTINSNWSVKLGTVTGSASGGWDGTWDKQWGNWAFLGGATWTSNDAATTLTVLSTAGKQSTQNQDTWALYSVVGTHNLTDKLHYVIQHDHGFANNVQTNAGKNQNAQWYGINQYLTYDATDKITVGLRAEWFSDPDGFRMFSPVRCGASTNAIQPAPAIASYACGNTNGTNNVGILYSGNDFYAITIGANYKPAKWLSLRPNLRYDYSTARAFDFGWRNDGSWGGKRKDQLMFSADMVVSF